MGNECDKIVTSIANLEKTEAGCGADIHGKNIKCADKGYEDLYETLLKRAKKKNC